MSEENNPEGVDPEEFAKFLNELVSGNTSIDPAELAKVAGLPNDPLVLKALMDQLKRALVEGQNQTVAGVNWKLAEQQALALAKDGGFSVTDATTEARQTRAQPIRLRSLTFTFTSLG